MEFNVTQVAPKKIAGFHMVGPWEKTVRQGFEQLALWVKTQQIPATAWLAVYYDNPDVVPAEKLRCDTVVAVADDFVVPENSEGVITTHIDAGQYAVARARVDNNDFTTPWKQFFEALLADSRYDITGGPCFEHYLNDGTQSGVWEIDMYVSVSSKR